MSEKSEDRRANESRPPSDPYPSRAGLCPRCLHVRKVTSATGSVFYLCRRSQTDARFPKYPPQPVVACHGFES